MTKNATPANGEAMPALTRRAALFGALASTAALAVPAAGAVASVQPECRPELIAAAEAFRAAHVAVREWERAWKAADRAFGEQVKAERLSIRLDMTMPSTMKLDASTTADYALFFIKEEYAEKISRAKARNASGHPLNGMLYSAEELTEQRAALLRLAQPTVRKYQALRRAHRLDELALEDDKAYRTAASTKEALFAFVPQSLAEVGAIASALHRAGEESGGWIDLPTHKLLSVLAVL